MKTENLLFLIPVLFIQLWTTFSLIFCLYSKVWTVCLRDLDKLNLIRFGFRLESIFITAPAALKNTTQFKRDQK